MLDDSREGKLVEANLSSPESRFRKGDFLVGNARHIQVQIRSLVETGQDTSKQRYPNPRRQEYYGSSLLVPTQGNQHSDEDVDCLANSCWTNPRLGRARKIQRAYRTSGSARLRPCHACPVRCDKEDIEAGTRQVGRQCGHSCRKRVSSARPKRDPRHDYDERQTRVSTYE